MKKSHKQQVLEILQDYQPHSTFEITERMFGTADTQRVGLFRLGGRIGDLRNDGHRIKSWKDKDDPRKHWYQLERQILPYTEERYENLLKKYMANSLCLKITDDDPRRLLAKLRRTRKNEEREELRKRIYYRLATMFGGE